MVIVAIVVLMALYQGLVPEVQTAGNLMGDDAKCTDADCFYNASLSTPCTNASASQDIGCLNAVETIPLSNLFSGTGIVALLIMFGLFIVIIKMVMPKKNKK